MKGSRMRKKLPVGIENFEKLRTEDFYYVDKTGMIQELLRNWGEVNLFTRPRRFGKSLNMNTLQYFFEYGCAGSVFDGLRIAEETELCAKYMGKFPVISITLKEVVSAAFEGAKGMLGAVIGQEALRFSFLKESERLSEEEKQQYAQLIKIDQEARRRFLMTDEVLEGSLSTLSRLLCRHYGQKVILLIDEYDVPLDKAEQYGYYEEMIGLIRNLFGQALKTNHSLQFAVLTGCLRIAKESVFTGLNNFKVFSIADARYDEYFGFTDQEVRDMLVYYELEDRYEMIREWYDGYRFGSTDVYCPWDVINYVDLLLEEPEALPRAFWINTSGNDIIRRFLQMSKQSTRRELERLIAGECVTKKLNLELTYRDLYRSLDHLWSVLFTTGYLTGRRKADADTYELTIPNREIRKIFEEQVLEWFQEEAKKDHAGLSAFCEAFARGDAEEAQKRFQNYLKKTISIRDSAVQKQKKENFYQGILIGLLSYPKDWDVCSNAESGEGYSDILIEIPEKDLGIVVEVKYAETEDLDAVCETALAQIRDREYASRLLEDGMDTILRYGIACRKKRCRIKVEK